MKTITTITNAATTEWAIVPVVAKAFHCSRAIVHRWGKSGRFGYRQIRPRRFVVNVSEAVEFYTKRYPNIEIDRETLCSMIQSTA